MIRREIDPDLTRRDDAAYWAAAMVVAVRAGDADRVETARQNLQRLGYHLDVCNPRGSKGKGAQHDG